VRIVRLDDRAVGLRLGQPVTDYRGDVLLQRGVELTPRYIGALLERGFLSVPVHDPLAPDAIPVEAIRQRTRRAAVSALEDAVGRAERGGRIAMPAICQVMDRILDDTASSSDLAFNLSTLRSTEDVLFTHSVNVCVYALILARSVALDQRDMVRLGVGALLHDIGKIFFLDVARKHGSRTAEEQETLKRHTVEGFGLLRDQGGVHLLSAHVALQHHEKLDGSGHPRHLQGDTIHPWARLVAVADRYDRLVSEREGRPALRPHEAMARLQALADEGKIDARLVRHLAWRLAAYPEGTIVLLESGEVAVVVAQTPEGGARPRARVLCDGRLQPVTPEERILTQSSAETTVRAVLPEYPPELLRRLGSEASDPATKPA
jgi:HD-GYP domain-containing protein (c-di-GMP phosphodiesterase class II)